MATSRSSLRLEATRQEKASGFLSATLFLLGLLTLVMLVAWLSQQTRYSPSVARLHLRANHEQGSGSRGDAEIFRPWDSEPTEDQPLAMEETTANLQTVSTLAISELATLDQAGGFKGEGLGFDEGDSRAKGPGKGVGMVVPNWQRWQIRYSAADHQEYASILDAFRVELGVLDGQGATIDYARQLSQPRPLIRSGKQAAEQRLCFIFQRGELKEADRALAQKAGLSVDERVVCQFFPDSVKAQLEMLERDALGTRALASVRRTQFGIRQGVHGLEFFVERVELAFPSGGLSPL